MKTEPRDSWSRPSSTAPDTHHSPKIKQSDSPPPIKTSDSPPPCSSSIMSDKNNSSSSSSDKTDWNSLLKHSSALGILKPGIVFNSSYGSGSSSTSGSSSSRFTSSYSGSQGGSSSIWSSGNVSITRVVHHPPARARHRGLFLSTGRANPRYLLLTVCFFL